MRTTNVIQFPMQQRKAAKPPVVTMAKPFLVVPKTGSGVPANTVLDEFAIWAGRLGWKLVSYSARRAQQ